jgi:hypothetical protein
MKLEIYKWCPKAKAYVLETASADVVIGMLKAKKLAVKGFENSFNESLIRSPFIDSVKSIEVSA